MQVTVVDFKQKKVWGFLVGFLIIFLFYFILFGWSLFWIAFTL